MRLSAEQRLEIKQLAEAGRFQRELAARFGVSQATIWKVLHADAPGLYATPRNRTDNPAYATRHSRVLAARGRAAGQTCTDCGGRAHDWSQRHGSDGTDPSHYEPRCNACHQKYDGAGAKPGELHHNARLTEAQVLDIRARPDASSGDLAKRYGVAMQTVYDIRAGRRWKHLLDADRGAGAYNLEDLKVTVTQIQPAS